MRAVGVLVAVSLLAAALSVGPMAALFGRQHLACGFVSFGLAMPPAVLTLWLTRWLARRSPYGALLGFAIGPVVRLPVVLGAAAAVFLLARDGVEWGSDFAHPLTFWLWVLFAYLVTLLTETALLARPALSGVAR